MVTALGGLALEDPAHAPAVMSTHGARGVDVVGVEFADATATMNADLAGYGALIVNCEHGGGHCGSTSPIKVAQWQYMKDHPFGTVVDPYGGALPGSFPVECVYVSP